MHMASAAGRDSWALYCLWICLAEVAAAVPGTISRAEAEIQEVTVSAVSAGGALAAEAPEDPGK